MKKRNCFFSFLIGIIFISVYSCKKDSTDTNTVKDIDGNSYHYVKIGTQTWMTENLRTTKYRNGDPIPNVTSNAEWVALKTGGMCYYDNNQNKKGTDGGLYNWYAANDARNIAPAGWHLPSKAEWQKLLSYLTTSGKGFGGSGDDVAKSLASTTGWETFYVSTGDVGYDQKSNNSSGFNALPSGYRDDDGIFWSYSAEANWWFKYDSTEYNNIIYISYDGSKPYFSNGYKREGYSIRCVKDSI